MIIQNIPGLSVLGCGYDVFGIYASPESATYPLFDLGNMTKIRPGKEEYTYQIPELVKYKSFIDTVYEMHTGKSVESFRTSLTNKTRLAGSYGFFSGSLEVGFNSTSFRVTTMAFTKIMQLITRWILKLPAPDDLERFLLRDVKKDIDRDLEPVALFRKYGTHYLSSLIVGGRIKYTSSTDTERFGKKEGLDVTAKMSLEFAAGNISASNQTKYKKDIERFRESSQIKIRARGGSPEYIAVIDSGITQDNWQAWAASVDENLEFVGFVDSETNPSLRPIWELCSDADRMKSLKVAYHEYAEKQPCEIKAILYPVYRHTAKEWRLRFTLSMTRDPVQAHGSGWSQGDPVFYAFKEQEEGTVPIYQYYAKHNRGLRFGYSINGEEALGPGWFKDHIAFYAYKEQEEGTVPIYQAHADDTWRYAYSTIDVGSEAFGEGWVNDGPAFYAYAF